MTSFPLPSAPALFAPVAMSLAVWRIIRGPRAHDRVLSLDTLESSDKKLSRTMHLFASMDASAPLEH